MPTTSWFNENEARDYPFLTRTIPLTVSGSSLSRDHDLPAETIVDFGAVMGIDSGFLEARHRIYLAAIYRDNDSLLFEFRTTAEEAADEILLFRRDIAAAEFEIDWQESASFVWQSSSSSSSSTHTSPSSSSSSSSSGNTDSNGVCRTAAKWSGFLVTGKLDAILEILPNSGQLVFHPGLWQVEPGRIQSLLRGFVKTLNLANYDRTHVGPSRQCDGSQSSSSQPAVITNRQCLTGHLAMKPGYNCSIRQDDGSNTLVISASRGSGEGEPCAEVPLYTDEVPPAGSPFLSGGPACNQVLHTVLGKSGRDLRIVTGSGIRIAPDTDLPHTLRISTALEDFALCVPQ